ncbi:MAG: tetratricopeptide repeat-containing glycosyltransferase family protein [Alphaproteobacteria bacterium]
MARLKPVKFDLEGAAAVGAAPAQVRVFSGIAGENTSRQSLAQLAASLKGVKLEIVQQYLGKASLELDRGHPERAEKWALKALEVDERSGISWHTLATCREMAGDFASSIRCYEAALALIPEDNDITNNLGRLASRMGDNVTAEKFFRLYLARYPGHPEGANNLGSVLRSQSRFDEAIEVLKEGLAKNPERAMLWNGIGSVMADIGDIENGLIFYEECLRIDPKFSKARYNRGTMRLASGDVLGALQDCDKAISQTKAVHEVCMMRMARASMLLNLGRLSAGWDEYETRLDANFSDCTLYSVGDLPQWKPNTPLAGKSLLLICEQGLGDEILFGTILHDIVEQLGPEGKLTLVVERRLVSLFQRSFPTAVVGAHITYSIQGHDVRVLPFLNDDFSGLDLWTPIGSLMRQYRRTTEDFPDRVGYLKPDPDRVAFWRDWLNSLPDLPKVGLLWKSAVISAGRHRYFSPFDHWEPIIGVPGITIVNLQYGDCDKELTRAREEFGVEIIQPPGIDLKQDLDEVTALCAAMDLVIGFSNATFNMAAAAGSKAWLILPPGTWTSLGTGRYPWYPQVRVFVPEAFNNWGPVMAEIASELAEFVGNPAP